MLSSVCGSIAPHSTKAAGRHPLVHRRLCGVRPSDVIPHGPKGARVGLTSCLPTLAPGQLLQELEGLEQRQAAVWVICLHEPV